MSRNQREGRWHVQQFRGNYVRSPQRDYVVYTKTRRDRKAEQREGRAFIRAAAAIGRSESQDTEKGRDNG